jgi:AcrR family transcriptional regulator
MPKDLSDAGGGSAERDPRTASRALERLRQDGLERDAKSRGELELAALEASGEVGYRKLTVALMLGRSGVGRAGFYKLFKNKAECYFAGYEIAIEGLCEELLEAGAAEPSWQRGIKRALEVLADFLAVERPLAKGLLAEVHVAGGAAMVKRKEVLERLSRAVDSARRETKSRHSPPPIAAEFIVMAIEESVVSSIARGVPEQFAATVPDLTFLAVSIFFGSEAAQRQLESEVEKPGKK